MAARAMPGGFRGIFQRSKLWPVLFILAMTSPSAWAEIGTIQSQIEETNTTEMDPEIFSEPPENATTATPQSTVPLDVNRTWMLKTQAGPTAFVLDAGQFELGIPLDRFSQLIWSGTSTRPLASVTYGLSNWLSAELRAGRYAASGAMKWNFWNPDPWSFSISPSVGIQFAHKSMYDADREQPIALALAASRVIDPSRKIHFSLELGKSEHSSSYGESSEIYGFIHEQSGHFSTARFSASYELRLNRRHGASFSLSPGITRSTQVSHYVNGKYQSDSTLFHASTFLELGVGYQYLLDHFGFELGAAIGPKWTHYRYAEYESSYQRFPLSLTGGVSWRL